ncbi:hypothetical protein WJ62_05135 [Burkholderia diffusa]|nr:hypothetical protein WJ62_05135 [Burkholderia diffusa]
MPRFPLGLPHAVDGKQRGAERFLPKLLQQAGPQDHVHLARLVLERHEQHGVGRARPLAHRDQSACARELLGRLQAIAQQLHWRRPRVKPITS